MFAQHKPNGNWVTEKVDSVTGSYSEVTVGTMGVSFRSRKVGPIYESNFTNMTVGGEPMISVTVPVAPFVNPNTLSYHHT